MSRILKNIVNNKIGCDPPYHVLYIGEAGPHFQQMAKDSNCSWTLLNKQVNLEDISNDVSLDFHCVVSDCAEANINDIGMISSKLRLPALLVHCKSSSQKTEIITQMAFQYEKFYNIVRADRIREDLRIFDAEVFAKPNIDEKIHEICSARL